VNNWSEGCQVINGSAYLGPNNERVDCSSIVATNNGEIASNPSKTRGAYSLRADLVLGLGSDLPGNSVCYMLLTQQDLALTTHLSSPMRARRRACWRVEAVPKFRVHGGLRHMPRCERVTVQIIRRRVSVIEKSRVLDDERAP
jgi:hypothetical protein